jgi:hypothetical protein
MKAIALNISGLAGVLAIAAITVLAFGFDAMQPDVVAAFKVRM